MCGDLYMSTELMSPRAELALACKSVECLKPHITCQLVPLREQAAGPPGTHHGVIRKKGESARGLISHIVDAFSAVEIVVAAGMNDTFMCYVLFCILHPRPIALVL